MIYLNNNDFFEKFDELISNTKREFFKLETCQSYSEHGIEDWESITSVDMKKIIEKTQTNASKQIKDKNLYLSKGIKMSRVRYLEFPLSKYILRQFSAYSVIEKIGKKISILEGKHNLQNFDKKYFRDFLIFDESHLLIHNYNRGELDGAIYTNDREEIQNFVKVKDLAQNLSIPFYEFTDNYNISFKVNV